MAAPNYLQFRSNMIEAYAAAEIYPTVFLERYDGLKGKFRPYGLAGFGIFKFNPKGEYFDASGRSSWVPLAPLHTEGQGFDEYPDRKPYKLFSFEMPLGAGFKYYFAENKYIGMELVHRKSFTDYVDDVSTTYVDPALFDKYLTPDKAAMAKQLYYRKDFPNANTRPGFGEEQRGDPTDNDSFFSTVVRFGWWINSKNSPEGRAARQMRCPSFY